MNSYMTEFPVLLFYLCCAASKKLDNGKLYLKKRLCSTGGMWHFFICIYFCIIFPGLQAMAEMHKTVGYCKISVEVL